MSPIEDQARREETLSLFVMVQKAAPLLDSVNCKNNEQDHDQEC